jgi:uncharacterized damage-inducible protein DinB
LNYPTSSETFQHWKCRICVVQKDNADSANRFPQPENNAHFGASIAHIITHSMHHRAQILNMLRKLGVSKIPEGDVFSWENDLN